MFRYDFFKLEDVRVDHEGAAATGVESSRLPASNEAWRHDWESDRCVFFLSPKGGKRKGLYRRGGGRPYISGPVYLRSHATRIMRARNSPFHLSAVRIPNVISFPSPSKSKGGAFRQRRQHDGDASLPETSPPCRCDKSVSTPS